VPLEFRNANEQDLPGILELILSDALAGSRVPADTDYVRAFAEILQQPDNEMVVGIQDGSIIATLQITFIPGLGYGGGWRAQLESVRVREDLRGQGIGAKLVEWAIERARVRGCRIVQLTSDIRRVDARRFYERLGFETSHIGMKLVLGKGRP
jgi:GNAT superfamily N-acetyltransferase